MKNHINTNTNEEFRGALKRRIRKKKKICQFVALNSHNENRRSEWLVATMKGIDCDVISAIPKEAVEPNEHTNAHETLRCHWIIPSAYKYLSVSVSLSLPLSFSSTRSLCLSMNKYWIFVNTHKIRAVWNKWWENWKSFTAAMTSRIYDGKKREKIRLHSRTGW